MSNRGEHDSTPSSAGSDAGAGDPPVTEDLGLGAMIGRYEIRRRLGEGGMGRVYLARDVVLGRLVALKLVGGTRDVERFLQEARAVARLNHPNVVRLYDFGEHRSFLYLALEYVEGQTLREQVPGDRHIREVLHHIRAVADALSHAHASGVLHCDLKLNNIMIGRDGRIRVVDFGLARTTDSRYSATGGTPDWMAPEQWAGGPITDRVDSWALGIVTAQLLAGAHPLGDNPDTRHRAAQDPSRVASFRCERRDVPAAMIDLVVQSLERNPALRPSTAEWVRMLDDALAGPGDAQPRRRRRRWISLDIALVLVGAAAMAVFLVMGRCAARETDRIDAGEHSARCGSGSE